MKYFTREWYNAMQKTYMYFVLKISKNAENFSEKYYKYLYEQEENKWIKFQEEVSTIKGDNFDLIQEKKYFNQIHNDNIKQLKSQLPTEILDEVADIRVLALNRASTRIKKLITKYCKGQERIVEKTIKEYQQYCDEELKDCKDEVIPKLCLHDSLITAIIKENDKMIVELDTSESFSKVKSIIFEDYEIKEQGNCEGGWWLYEEIYFEDNKYEVHVLIDNPKSNQINLEYFTIKAKNIRLQIGGKIEKINLYKDK